MALECELGIWQPSEFAAWVHHEIGKPNPDEMLFEIFERPKHEWDVLLIHLARKLNNFQINSKMSEKIAKQLLTREAQRFLTEKISPYEFCGFFSKLEAMFDYPFKQISQHLSALDWLLLKNWIYLPNTR